MTVWNKNKHWVLGNILMFFLTTAVIYKTKLLLLVKEGCWIF